MVSIADAMLAQHEYKNLLNRMRHYDYASFTR